MCNKWEARSGMLGFSYIIEQCGDAGFGWGLCFQFVLARSRHFIYTLSGMGWFTF
jgi:hypothetical protein